MAHHTGTNPSVFIRMMDLFTIEADGVNHEELMAKSRKGVSLIQMRAETLKNMLDVRVR